MPQPPTPPPRRSSQPTPWGLGCIKKDVALSRSFSSIADGLRLAHAHTLAVVGVPDTQPPSSSARAFSLKKGTRASFHGRGILRPHDQPSFLSPCHALPRSCPQSPAIPRPHRSLLAISTAAAKDTSYLSRPRTLLQPPQDEILSVRALLDHIALGSPCVASASLSPRPSPRTLPRPSLYRSSFSRSNPNLSSSPSSSSSSFPSSGSQMDAPLNTIHSQNTKEDEIDASIWEMTCSSYSLPKEDIKDPFPLLKIPHSLSHQKTAETSKRSFKNSNIQSKSVEPLHLSEHNDRLHTSLKDQELDGKKSSGFLHQDRYNSYRSLDDQDSSPPPPLPLNLRRQLPIGFSSESSRGHAAPSIIHRHQMRTKPLNESYLDESDVFRKSSDLLSLREDMSSPNPSPNPSICSLPVHSSTNDGVYIEKTPSQRKSSPRNHYHHLRYLHHHHNMFPSVSSLRLFSSSSGLFPGALEWDFDYSSGGEGVGGESSFFRANPIAPSTPTQQSSPKPPPSTPPSRIGCDPSNPVLSMSLR